MHPDPARWRTRLDEGAIARFTDSGAWRNQTLGMRLDRLCQETPDHVLIIDDHGAHSAVALRRKALRFAGALAALGLQRGDVVSFQLPNWHEAMIIDLACAYGGFVCNPIVPIYREHEVGFIVRGAQTRVLIVPDEYRDFAYAKMADRLQRSCPQLDHVFIARSRTEISRSLHRRIEEGTPISAAPPDPNHVKLLLYTSGTTADPKGVMHTHNTIDAEIHNFGSYLGLTSDDVVLMPSTLCHVTGYLYAIQLPVTLGAKAILMEKWSAEEAAHLIEQHKVTLTIGATPFLQELSQFALDSGRRLPSLRYFPTGGAPVPPSVVELAERSFARCLSFRVYGSTEAPTVTLGALGDQPRLRRTTEGRVVGHEMRIVDDRNVPCAAGKEGEIVTRGPELFVGYAVWSENADAFDTEGFFHSGDLGMMTSDGCLIVTGRKKDIIIRGGENISSKEIEDLLATLPEIREVAVVGMPHERLGETCCTFVSLREGASLQLDDVRRAMLQGGFAKQKWPERLEVLEQLPRTAAGKISKKLLREMIRRSLAAEDAGSDV